MQSRVTQIAPDLYRICTFRPDYGIQFNQFLLCDDEPFLMHTGYRKMFDATLEGVASVIDPATLRWVGFSHFESDECGALNEWLAVAPSAQALCSFVGAVVTVNDFATRPPRALADGEAVVTGRHRLRFLATPHLPHGWDAGLFFDEAGRTLFCSDLFFHPGDPEPLAESDVIARARDAIAAGRHGPLARDMPFTPYTCSTLRRLAELEPQVFAVMHGSSFHGHAHAGRRALEDLAQVIDDLLGRSEPV